MVCSGRRRCFAITWVLNENVKMKDVDLDLKSISMVFNHYQAIPDPYLKTIIFKGLLRITEIIKLQNSADKVIGTVRFKLSKTF